MLEGDNTGLIKRSAAGIQMVIFIELVQYGKNLGGKSRKNLVQMMQLNFLIIFVI